MNAPVTAYKGFNADWACYGGFKYEIGQHYKGDNPVRCGSGGFHACEMPLDVWSYYGPATSKFATVEQSGGLARGGEGDDSKAASAEITIKAEIHLSEMIHKAVDSVTAAAKTNLATGYNGHAAASGGSGHAAAAGEYGHAAAAGDYGHAAVKGKNAIAAALGFAGVARAGEGGAIMLAAYDNNYQLVAVFASKVGENGIKAGEAYRLRQDGKPELVEGR